MPQKVIIRITREDERAFEEEMRRLAAEGLPDDDDDDDPYGFKKLSNEPWNWH